MHIRGETVLETFYTDCSTIFTFYRDQCYFFFLQLVAIINVIDFILLPYNYKITHKKLIKNKILIEKMRITGTCYRQTEMSTKRCG